MVIGRAARRTLTDDRRALHASRRSHWVTTRLLLSNGLMRIRRNCTRVFSREVLRILDTVPVYGVGSYVGPVPKFLVCCENEPCLGLGAEEAKFSLLHGTPYRLYIELPRIARG